MSRQIVKQPNGKYAIWSSIVDDFICLDATPDEIIEVYIEDATREIRKSILETIAELDAGGKPSFQFTMSWDECLQWIKTQHGRKSETWKLMNIDPKSIKKLE